MFAAIGNKNDFIHSMSQQFEFWPNPTLWDCLLWNAENLAEIAATLGRFITGIMSTSQTGNVAYQGRSLQQNSLRPKKSKLDSALKSKTIRDSAQVPTWYNSILVLFRPSRYKFTWQGSGTNINLLEQYSGVALSLFSGKDDRER